MKTSFGLFGLPHFLAAIVVLSGLPIEIDLYFASSLSLSLSLFRSGLLLGIWERRCSHQVRGIRALIAGDESLANALVHGAVRGAWLVRKAGDK